MAELKPFRGDYYLWKYLPSLPAAIVALLLFSALLLLHVRRIWITKAWFCISLNVGILFEIIGYATRTSARNKTDKLMPFAVQQSMILLAPVLFAASIYMTLGRIIRSLGAESCSILPARWLTRFFVTADVLALVVQAGSTPLMFIGDGKYTKLSEGVVIAGLAIQIIAFSLFIVTTAIFHRRASPQGSLHRPASWKMCLHMLYAVSALVLFRSIFRVIEYIQGNDGYLLGNEWTLYVFDTVPMLLVVATYYWLHPTKFDIQAIRVSSPSGVELVNECVGENKQHPGER